MDKLTFLLQRVAERRTWPEPRRHRREGGRRGAEPAPLHSLCPTQRAGRAEWATSQRGRVARGQRAEAFGALPH